MIIVPTEKQLDWRNAPLVLCALVLLNVMVFFLYQSGDNRKIMDAMTQYEARDYFKQEWPIYQDYLVAQEQQEKLDKYRSDNKKNNSELVMYELVTDENFYNYLQDNARSFFSEDFYSEWRPERTQINNKIQSLSYLAHGLRANNLHISAFITHQFLHGDIMHLLGNMFFLIICGFAVEAAIGHWRFLLFYLVSGVAAGFAQVASDWSSSQPLIGASGAISGVMAMYLAVFRWKEIEFFYWFFFFVGYFRAPALLILPFYVGNEVYSYYHETDSNVAFMAHAGGFVAGAMLIGLAWLFNRSVLNYAYIETDQSIDTNQQAMADIYDAIEKCRFTRALELVDEAMKICGVTFELTKIRYNLLKISRGDDYLAAATSLITLPRLSESEIKVVEKVWQENTELLEQLTEQEAIKLGVHFSTLENPKSAEQLFQHLLEKGSKGSMLSVFASKLASSFQRVNNLQKKTHYANLSKQLAEGAEHGLL